MKKTILHTLLLAGAMLPAWSFAGFGDNNRKLSDDKKHKKEDTTQTINTTVAYDDVDSLLMFPSHDLYGAWDTVACHPNLFEQQFAGDSAVVYLLDDENCGFTMPTKGIITSEFGWRHRRPHYGTDIALHIGDTVGAAFDGKVRIARYIGGYGNVIIVRHNNGLETVYAHLSKILVQPGDNVTNGMTIGLGGNTGRSFGSHLHFEIRYLGKAIDTEDLVDYEKQELKNTSFVLYKSDFGAKYDLRSIHAHQIASKSHAAPVYKNAGGTHLVFVKKGDTLEKIARRNHTTIAALCKKNGISKNKVLRLGQKLKV
ncbi:MAG: peptidoglycan DD-metalloendopeptidase family protein [Bacteroidetes bacterium]|nr:peptidoglycan DD-metalloendopeptidase family protein [Bacteroidota bacterium]